MPMTSKYQKFSLSVLLRICLTFFCQFQPGVAYKSVAYKKCVYLFKGLHIWFCISRIKNPRNVSTKERPNKGEIPLWMRFQRLLNFSQIQYFLSVNNY